MPCGWLTYVPDQSPFNFQYYFLFWVSFSYFSPCLLLNVAAEIDGFRCQNRKNENFSDEKLIEQL